MVSRNGLHQKTKTINAVQMKSFKQFIDELSTATMQNYALKVKHQVKSGDVWDAGTVAKRTRGMKTLQRVVAGKILRKIGEAHTPTQLDAAQTKYTDRLKTKADKLKIDQHNAGLMKGVRDRMGKRGPTYDQFFTKKVAGSEHAVKRTNQALSAIQRLKNPAPPKPKTLSFGDRVSALLGRR